MRLYTRRRAALLMVSPLIAFGLWQTGGGAYIHAKAWLAQALLESAWARNKAGDPQARPWPWADTWPVARLTAPRLGISRIVLAGASGRTLAFGPGHMDGTAAPGAPGTSIIGGHRDTHFAFLRKLKPGDALTIETPGNGTRAFRVTDAQVVHHKKARLRSAEDAPALALVTCWPFYAVETGGPMRYVVSAAAVDEPTARPRVLRR